MKRILNVVGITLGLFLLIVLSPLIGFMTECQPFADNGNVSEVDSTSLVDPEIEVDRERYRRNEEQTYLTLPEWYIVFNSVEYAEFIKDRRPSQFPYLRAISQYWSTYYRACEKTRDEYAFNGQYHLMLTVIGVSFTAETLVRGLYENTIGRVSEWTSSSPTEEDRYGQTVAEEYGSFLYRIPWFEFPFREKLNNLWADTTLWGPGPIRKWERKLALSFEYGLKGWYGNFIRSQVEDPYLFIKEEISVWVIDILAEQLSQIKHVHLLREINDMESIVTIPREHFTKTMTQLVGKGARFTEVAGNDVIVLSAIAPKEWRYELESGSELYSMPVLPDPEYQRVAIDVSVSDLHTLLNKLAAENVNVERIYDY